MKIRHTVGEVGIRSARSRGVMTRYVWLVGFSLCATSVTIASIPVERTTAESSLARSSWPRIASSLGNHLTAQSTTEEKAGAEDYAASQHAVAPEPSLLIYSYSANIADKPAQPDWIDESRSRFYLIPGQQLRIRTMAAGGLQELIPRMEPRQVLRLTSTLAGVEFLSQRHQFETRTAYVVGTIEESLFKDGQEAGLSDKLITDLAEIFGWDIDFSLELRPGDSFAVIYEERHWQGQKVADGNILAAEFVNQGQLFRALAWRDESGGVNYYRPDGQSLRREFLRSPVKLSRVSSDYSDGRFHPILKTWRAHKGIDYAAPAGTPVRATATGTVSFVGTQGGYGKTMIIDHRDDYTTLYAHLAGFRGDLKVGMEIEQGEVIGYVGRTGLATGPHLHYEFQLNGAHRNPATFEASGDAPIPAADRPGFARDAQAWEAKLDLIGRSPLVSNR